MIHPTNEQPPERRPADAGRVPVRVLLVEDHPIYRDGLRSAFADCPELSVIGEAGDGAAAVELAQRLRPDVVLMDLNLPGLSGVEATRQITEAGSATVLVLTMHEDESSLIAAIRAGAAGYVLKGADQHEVLRTILAVAAGEAVFGTNVAGSVLRLLATAGHRTSRRPFPELTDRELEILDLVAQGHGNHAIATRLRLSPKTVRNHVSTILTKLHAADRGEAIVRARAVGLGH